MRPKWEFLSQVDPRLVVISLHMSVDSRVSVPIVVGVDYFGPVRILVAVTNDLSTDQRVDKSCMSLLGAGHEVRVFCRSLVNSMPLHRPYQHERMELIFVKGPLFYLEYNFRLLLKLLRTPGDIILANDLDTLLGCYLASVVKDIPLIYDSHEYFTEVPELEGRWAKKAWLRLETWIFPKLKYVYTVNKSIAQIYEKTYGVNVGVLRNVPHRRHLKATKDRLALDLPEHRRILILQGAGINVDRGAEELLSAMPLLGEEYYLLIIGAGDVFETLKRRVSEESLHDLVRIIDRQPYERMMQYTLKADLGLTLDKNKSLNYRYSLPNKVFDYISAGIPVMSSDLTELRRLIDTHGVGILISEVTPESIAAGVREAFSDTDRYQSWRSNVAEMQEALDWAKEVVTLTTMVDAIEKRMSGVES